MLGLIDFFKRMNLQCTADNANHNLTIITDYENMFLFHKEDDQESCTSYDLSTHYISQVSHTKKEKKVCTRIFIVKIIYVLIIINTV